MALNLDQTLAWKQSRAARTPDAAAELAMLNDLQGNILKGHGRDYTSNIFVTFDPAKAAGARGFVASIGHDVTPALDQLIGAETHRTTGIDAGTFISLLISAKGYDALGCGNAKPSDEAFNAGMATRDQLNDPSATEWDTPLVGLHAMILVAAANGSWRDAERQAILARVAATHGAVSLKGFLDGNAMHNKDDNGIEHFGYVDGRSQPLPLQEDVDVEQEVGGIDKWNPSIPLSQVLVKDPGGRLEVSHGSYFVIRKLEQNVRGFKLREKALAAALDAEAATRGNKDHEPVDERAGASVIGRFENGTPVAKFAVSQSLANQGNKTPPNNFNFDNDNAGLKCPYAGHIRKTNPRNDVPDSKSHLMARRGIPYGDRTDGPNDDRTDNKPSGGVGLIFMAYQASIENQFEFTQSAWVNNPEFARSRTGIDPVIGQVPKPLPEPPPTFAGQLYPVEWGHTLSNQPFDFSGFVKMRGGEYLFAPSISFLKSLK